MEDRAGWMGAGTVTPAAEMLSREELRDRLLAVGASRYHHRHPFHVRMHEGLLSRGQMQAWALNRYYYQSRIPIKDALLLAKSEDPAFRRPWRKRIAGVACSMAMMLPGRVTTSMGTARTISCHRFQRRN